MTGNRKIAKIISHLSRRQSNGGLIARAHLLLDKVRGFRLPLRQACFTLAYMMVGRGRSPDVYNDDVIVYARPLVHHFY